MKTIEYLEKLNNEQKQAVLDTSQVCMVNASVGRFLYLSAKAASSAITFTSFLCTSFNASCITIMSVLSPT